MEPRFEHTKFEEKIYQQWEDSGVFKAPTKDEAESKSQKPFTIIMPPPNANDPLHVGHAMFVSIEDILVRYHRMRGDATMWLPGTDHAGIETQFVFEKKLAKIGKSRFDFDRTSLYQQIWDYVQENSGTAVNQMKHLGASADWSRFKFTLDPDIVRVVLETFIKLHTDNLVYRGERLVNYCTKCGTGYSELEVEHNEKIGKLYYLRYPIAGTKDEFVVVATTRPETLFGDTAVAVNPKDKRYKDLVGKKVVLPFVSKEIPVIADDMVDVEFGTGVVKITPAHDHNDWEVGKRHDLPVVQVIDFTGKLNSNAGEFAGLRVVAAREAVVNKLTEIGLIDQIKDYTNSVGECYRCHTPIEPLPLSQFFIRTEGLAKKALESLDRKETTILGAGQEKILRHWLTNIKDWNISRQIVWGIRLPVWYDTVENPDLKVIFITKEGTRINGEIGEVLSQGFTLDEVEAGLQTVRASNNAHYVASLTKPGSNYLQETDTFDTWFSSGQWPVATLKANLPGDFEFYYPTSVMETAYDILTRWVMRMMLFGLYLTDKSPFKYVYLHGLVRDEQGRKMSKSIGNVINPLDLVAKYGADALRMALVMSTTAGLDSAVGESKVKGMRNFANKIWNATRFVKTHVENSESAVNGPDDEVFHNRLNQIILDVTQQLEDLRIGLAAETIHNEFWHWFCDLAIEDAKAGKIGTTTLQKGLDTFLRLLHPFAPFVTESAWQESGHSGLLISQPWPKNA